jgi:hypothetical protein
VATLSTEVVGAPRFRRVARHRPDVANRLEGFAGDRQARAAASVAEPAARLRLLRWANRSSRGPRSDTPAATNLRQLLPVSAVPTGLLLGVAARRKRKPGARASSGDIAELVGCSADVRTVQRASPAGRGSRAAVCSVCACPTSSVGAAPPALVRARRQTTPASARRQDAPRQSPRSAVRARRCRSLPIDSSPLASRPTSRTGRSSG